jgi:hypothetical protein
MRLHKNTHYKHEIKKTCPRPRHKGLAKAERAIFAVLGAYSHSIIPF